jgi:hypothetical protein
MSSSSWTILAETDEQNRVVTIGVEVDPARHLVTLDVNSGPAESEWTWLTPARARIVAQALLQAADDAEYEPARPTDEREPAVPRPPFCPRCGLGMIPPHVGTTLAAENGPDVCNRCEEIEAYLVHAAGDECEPVEEWPLDPAVVAIETETFARVMRDVHGWNRWAATGHPNLPPEVQGAHQALLAQQPEDA